MGSLIVVNDVYVYVLAFWVLSYNFFYFCSFYFLWNDSHTFFVTSLSANIFLISFEEIRGLHHG